MRHVSYWHQDCTDVNDKLSIAVELTNQFVVRPFQNSAVEAERTPDQQLVVLRAAENSASGKLPGKLRRVFSFLTMLVFLLITLEFIMCRAAVVDPDIWWHLRNAQYLFQHHQLPRADTYSFTVAGHP